MKLVFEVVLQSLQLAIRGPGGQLATQIIHFPVDDAAPAEPTVQRKTKGGIVLAGPKNRKMAKLPPLTRRILKMRAKGMRSKEIAKKCKVSVSVVNNRVHEAKKAGVTVEAGPFFPVPARVERAVLGAVNGKRRF